MAGKLIVMEGIDGCGKETQIRLLKESREFSIYKYPTDNFQMLDDYLKRRITLDPKSLFLLFLADIAEEQALIADELKKGKTVILDRYVFSTIAYELGAVGYGRAKKIIEETGFLKPDKVILMDIPPSVSQERKKRQKELDRYEENVKYLEKVRNDFLKLAEENFMAKKWFKIDASKDISSINKELLKII
jgi:dTMP kinase